MKLLRRLIERYPYKGLFGWATACVWAFLIAEIMWHFSAFVRSYDVLEIPLVVPYAPFAFIVDPHDAMLNHDHIFFFALANWFGIFVVGALLSLRRLGTRVSGSGTVILVLAVALARAVEAWVIHPPGPMP